MEVNRNKNLNKVNKFCFNRYGGWLDESGVLIFKWNEEQIKLKQILDLIDYKPLIGNKRAKAHWLVFMKD